MWILSNWIEEVLHLILPARCAVCGTPLSRGEHIVCSLCRITAPLTGYCMTHENPVWSRCNDLLPVEEASAFLFFRPSGGWRRMIHTFKYHSGWRIARDMGQWYGRALRESGLYADVDAVIPLPLHPLKRLRRGYNQSEYLAEGIARQLGVPVNRQAVYRRRNTSAQALKSHRERARNVEQAFAVRHPERLAGKHLLLVDDVMTTGSTLLSCAEAIVRSVPECRISIAALAVVRNQLGERE